MSDEIKQESIIPEVDLRAELDAVRAKADENLAGWKRATADYQNLQKDVSRERTEMAQFAVLRVIDRLLPVLDNFKTAFNQKPPEGVDKMMDNWVMGIGFIGKQFEEAIRDLGLFMIKTIGEKFDPTRHEAIGDEVVEGTVPGIIIKEIQPGYEVLGKVMRVAKVIVAK